MLNIVLVEPEIPANTGNIARTCAVTGSYLHLIRPLGFSMDDKHLKRAGLDYWHLLGIKTYDSLEDFFNLARPQKFYLASTKGGQIYTEKRYYNGDFLLFGKETAGLPSDIIQKYPKNCVRIPMLNNANARSLNLSNSVAIILYEALRQNCFDQLN